MYQAKIKNMEEHNYQTTVNPKPTPAEQEELLAHFRQMSTKNMTHLSRVRIRSAIERLESGSITWGGIISTFLLTETKFQIQWQNNDNKKMTVKF